MAMARSSSSGDAPARFSFAADKAASLALPGLFARERLLALELKRDALFGASGLIRPNGAFAPSVFVAAARSESRREGRLTAFSCSKIAGLRPAFAGLI